MCGKIFVKKDVHVSLKETREKKTIKRRGTRCGASSDFEKIKIKSKKKQFEFQKDKLSFVSNLRKFLQMRFPPQCFEVLYNYQFSTPVF